MKKLDELSNPDSCMSRAKDDEMTFVLLGRDIAAPNTIRFWVDERIRFGKNKLEDAQIQEALACALSMEGEDESLCPVRGDELHCVCWYDGKDCCACGYVSPPSMDLSDEDSDEY